MGFQLLNIALADLLDLLVEIGEVEIEGFDEIADVLERIADHFADFCFQGGEHLIRVLLIIERGETRR